MEHLRLPFLIFLAMLLGLLATIIYNNAPRAQPILAPVITNFDECAQAGNAIMESYPRQCRTADGRLFVEVLPPGQNPSEIGGGGLSVNGCAVAGCSGQLCVSADEAGDIMTTCEYRAEYSCYREASCEPQADGACGWTQTPQLLQCLANPPQEEIILDLEAQ